MNAPSVQYVTTSDGYDIAYTVTGEGQPLVCVPSSFSHIQRFWSDSDRPMADWLHRIAERFHLVCYDSRGQGMSTRGIGGDLSVGAFVTDLEAVVDRTGFDSFVLFGLGNALGHVAIHYAAKHPKRVQALVLECSAIETTAWPLAHFVDLATQSWEFFLQNMEGPGSTLEQTKSHVQELQASVSQSDWLSIMRAFIASDVASLLPSLTMPTLILHPRDFKVLSVEESIKLAAQIPDSRLVLLEGASVNGNVEQGVRVIEEFVTSLPLREDRRPLSTAADRLPGDLSAREVEVLRLLAQGRSNPEIAKELFITRNTVQNHVSSILIKTNLNNRSQAAVYARDHSIV